jgi:hypothetical protein
MTEQPNLKKVHLNVGEPIIKLPTQRLPFKFELKNGTSLEEIRRYNGAFYVMNPNFPVEDLFNQTWARFSEVLVTIPHNSCYLDIYAMKRRGPLQALDDALKMHLDKRTDEGQMDLNANGILLIHSGERTLKERIVRGRNNEISSEVEVGHEGMVQYSLLRYAPATPENRQRFTDIFGPL